MCPIFKFRKNKKTITRNLLQDEKQQKYNEKFFLMLIIKIHGTVGAKGLKLFIPYVILKKLRFQYLLSIACYKETKYIYAIDCVSVIPIEDVRYKTLLYRYKTLLYRYKTLLYRYKTLLYRYKTLLYRYKTLLYRYKTLLYRYKTLLYRYKTLLYKLNRG